jgi:hypothetical protein
VAGAAVSLSLAAAAADPAHGVRVGVDGALPADCGLVADALAAAVGDAGRPVARVSREDFLRPRSVRLELGAGDPDAGWERWYDDGALRREVLDPLGARDSAGSVEAWAGPGEPRPPRSRSGSRAGGEAGRGAPMTWLPALWDADRDRSVRADRVVAAPGTVLVVTGPYLLRWELADAFDLVVHLDVSAAALARRLGHQVAGAAHGPADVDAQARTAARVAGSWDRYVEETAPAERATYIVRLEDPRHPALVEP